MLSRRPDDGDVMPTKGGWQKVSQVVARGPVVSAKLGR